MHRFSLVFIAILTFASFAHAQGTLSGMIQTPNSSVPIRNGTLTLTLSQSGVITGTATLSTSPVSCFTSIDGSIVGLKNPLTAPSLAPSTSSGSLGAGTYFVKYTGYGSGVETLPSPEASTVLLATGKVTVNLPSVPAGQTGWKVYVSTTTGTETQQGTTVSNSFVQSVALVSGAALPGTNNSLCQLRFNDSIIPYPTKYRVGLVDGNGATVPGFGFFAYLSGTSVNVSNGWPLARDIETRYFTPIISAPSSNASQSINSPLTLNGFQLSAGSVLGSGLTTVNAPGCPTSQGVIYFDTTLNKWEICQNGGAYADVVGNGGGWQRTAGLISENITTDKVLIGLTSTDIGAAGNGTVISAPFLYAIGTATNSRLVSVGVDIPGTRVSIASGVTGTQAIGYPLVFQVCVPGMTGDCSMDGVKEAGRLETSGRWILGAQSALSSDYAGGALIVEGSIIATNGPINAQAIRLAGTGGGNGSSDVAAQFSGTGSYKPLSFTTNGTRQVFIDTSGNVLVGTGFTPAVGADNATTGILEAWRDQNNTVSVMARNATSNTAALVSYLATSGAAAANTNAEFGYTSAGFTPTSGLVAAGGFVRTGAGGAGGLTLQSAAGTIKFQPGGTTTEMTLTSGSGMALNHALPVTSGGTGQTATLAVGGLIYGLNSTAIGSASTNVWDNANGIQSITGGMVLKTAARVNPAGGTALLHSFYDTGTDKGFIISVNYTGPAYKPLALFGSDIEFNAGATEVFDVTSNGPKWQTGFSTNAAAGGTTLSLASVTFPGSVGGIPYVWFKAVAADGTVVYIPAFK